MTEWDRPLNRIEELETTVDALKRRNLQQEWTIQALEQDLVALTQENVLLRAKTANFSSGKELALGLGHTRDLIKVQGRCSLIGTEQSTRDTHTSLFTEIEDIKATLMQKKWKHDARMRFYSEKVDSETHHSRASSSPFFEESPTAFTAITRTEKFTFFENCRQLAQPMNRRGFGSDNQ